jgi:N-glycosylase/DNA lyase
MEVIMEAFSMPIDADDINFERVDVIAELFCNMGLDKIARFDRLEPEFQALKALYERGIKPPYLSLISICTGVIDFNLGAGGAERLWATLVKVASDFDNLNDLKRVEWLMKAFLNEPINAPDLHKKITRLRKLFDSGFDRWFIENYEELKENPVLIWRRLSETLGSGMEQKTMVFAMKAFDISSMICFGEYAKFPWDITIPVDFHVRNVTVSAGLLEHHGTDDAYRKAWAQVAKNVKERMGGNISLLRIDSLVWQIGRIMYASNYNKNTSARQIQKYLVEKVGVEDKLAKRFAEELTKFIDKVAVGQKTTISSRNPP